MPAEKSRSNKSRARSRPTFVAAGRVVRPHGLRGDLLVASVSELIRSLQPGSPVFLGPDREAAQVASCRLHGTRWLLRLEACHDRDRAERWRGAEVAVRVDDLPPLPEGEYFYWQILGLQVVTEEGRVLGTVEEIIETGANDVYIVRAPDQPEILLPAIQSVVRQVDLAAGQIRVHLLPGLLAEA
jgi:16S rRNA processing protein RimM